MPSKNTNPKIQRAKAPPAAKTTPPAVPSVDVLEGAIDELRGWVVRGRATRAAVWMAPSDEPLAEPQAIRMTDLSARLGMLLDVVEAALGAADLGRSEDDQRVTTTVRPARRAGTMVEPASVTLTFGAAYQVEPALVPLGDEPGRWRKLARLSPDFSGFAWTWQRVASPRISDDELDALADRVVARERWPHLDELREMFRDVDRARSPRDAAGEVAS